MTDRTPHPHSLAGRKLARRGAAALLALVMAGLASTTAAAPPPFGHVGTFATVPTPPGFPEGISVGVNQVFVSGPATAGTAGMGPSKILVYKKLTGALEQVITVAGEDLANEHALSCNALDGQGRLYVLTAQLFAPPSSQRGILRFTKEGPGYFQETYSEPFPNLPSCAFGPLPGSCALPNDIAFDEDGNAYVSDSFQAVIWRVSAGGGPPEVWLASSILAGGGPFPIGVNGLRLDPARHHLYFSVSFSAANPSLGGVYRIPLSDNPDEADLELVHEYSQGESPDGIAFGASGKLYVALAASNEISVLAPNGTEIARIASELGDEIPLDGPANIAFDKKRKSLLVTNHASFSGDSSHFAVLTVFVRDKADPLETPHFHEH